MGRHAESALRSVLALGMLVFLLIPGALAIDMMPIAEAGPNRTVYVGDVSTINGSATDDGYIVKYEWDFEGDGTYDWSSTSTGVTTHVFKDPGTLVAKLRVTDNASQMDVDTVTIIVKTKNKAPAADAGPDKLGEMGLPVNMAASGNDPDGFIVKYEWDFESDGEWDYIGAAPNTTHIYYAQGDYYVTLRVTDNGSPPATDSDICKVTINPVNQKPTASIGALNPLTPEAGSAVVLVGKGNDADGEIAHYEWDFNGDGRWDWSSTSTGTVTTKYYEPGTYTAKFRVTDNAPIPQSETATATLTIIPLNHPPVLAGPSSMTVTAGKNVALGVTVLDPDGAGKIRKVAWDFDGNGLEDMCTSDGNINWTFNSSGVYTVNVTATDDMGGSASTRVLVTVKSAPVSESSLMSLLPMIILLLIGIGIGAGIGAATMRSYAKSHWEKFFTPTKLDRLKMKAELEHDELSASGFRGEEAISTQSPQPPAQQYGYQQAGQQYPQGQYAQGQYPPQGRGNDNEGSGFR